MRITIGKKLYSAFGLIIVLMLVIGGVAYRASVQADQGSTRIAEMLKDVKSGGEAVEYIVKMRMRAKDFLITNSQADIDAYEKSQANFLETLRQCEASFQDPERLANVQRINELFQQYDAAFEAVKQTVSERNKTVSGSLDKIGPSLIDRLKDYQHAEIESGDTAQVKLVAPVINDVFEARLYGLKYLRTSDHADRDRALAEIATARQAITEVMANEKDPAQHAALESMRADLVAYQSGLDQLAQLIAQRKELVLNTLDQISPTPASSYTPISTRATTCGSL